MKYKRYVVFDTETTGLQPDECQIIEFAALVLDENAKVIAEIDQFIKAESIPPKITELTGITKANTDDGIEELMLIAIINKLNSIPTLWIAHNAHFDLSFIRSTYARCGKDFDDAFKNCDFLDTLTVYRDRADKPHRLANAIEHYKCEDVENSHRAIDDVKALWAVVKAIVKERNDLGIYINVFGGNSSTPISRVKYKYQKYGFKERGKRLPEL